MPSTFGKVRWSRQAMRVPCRRGEDGGRGLHVPVAPVMLCFRLLIKGVCIGMAASGNGGFPASEGG